MKKLLLAMAIGAVCVTSFAQSKDYALAGPELFTEKYWGTGGAYKKINRSTTTISNLTFTASKPLRAQAG